MENLSATARVLGSATPAVGGGMFDITAIPGFDVVQKLFLKLGMDTSLLGKFIFRFIQRFLSTLFYRVPSISFGHRSRWLLVLHYPPGASLYSSKSPCGVPRWWARWPKLQLRASYSGLRSLSPSFLLPPPPPPKWD